MRKITLCFILSLCATLVFAKENVLSAVRVQPMPDNRVRIDFQFTDTLADLPASFITEKPQRLVLDFVNATSQIAEPLKTQKINIGSIDKYQIVGVSNRLRAIFDLTGAVTYSGSVSAKVYTLLVSGKGNKLISPKKEMFISNQPVNARFGIRNINFSGTEKQGGRITIDVSDTGIPIDVTQTGKEIVANFLSTGLPAQFNKRFDVADFHSPVQMFSAVQEGRNTKLTILNSGDYSHFAYQVNKQFIIDVFPLSEEEKNEINLKKKMFTGKRLSLNFQNIPVQSVLQVLADFAGFNIVFGDGIGAHAMTLRLNDVPWDQALDIILTSNGLDKRQVGNVVLVDTSENLAKKEQLELKEMRDAQKLAPIRSDLLQINYAKAQDIATLLKDKNNSLLSEQGKLSVDSRTNTIWLQDTGVKIEEIRDLVKKLDIPVKQVVIEARIVDVTKDFTRELGIRWGVSKPTHLSGTLEGANQLAQGVTAPNVTPIGDRLNVDLGATPVTGTAASVGIALAKLGGGVLLDLELSALESEGCAEVIASPRLMTTNQQPALIESGEEIPYQESTSSGATSVSFKKAVLSLKVTPQITPDGKMLMDLQINQDTPDYANKVNGVPPIKTKEIQTNVLVDNGQTIVLGGIYQRDKSNTVFRVPFLGRMPVLGELLFSHRTIADKKEELLIFITPRIITNNLAITTIENRAQLGANGINVDK